MAQPPEVDELNDPLGDQNALWDWASDGKSAFGLGDTADLANWIGRIIVGYSAIEFQFYMIFALINDLDANKSYRQFYSARAIHRKENLFWPYLTTLPIEYQNALKILWEKMRKAANRRTKVAHCVLHKRPGGRMLSLLLEGDKPFLSKLNTEWFRTVVLELRTLQVDVHVLQTFLKLLNPERWNEVLAQIPVPRNDEAVCSTTETQASLPPQAEAERVASITRLGLNSVIVLERSPHFQSKEYRLRFAGRLVLSID